MFSLDGTVKYWLYNKPVDMRKSFNGLSGIVTNGMCANLKSGDVYIFTNASRNMMKMLRQVEGGLVLYSIRLDIGRKSGERFLHAAFGLGRNDKGMLAGRNRFLAI